MKFACIGVGNVGRSWAVVFARAGHQVQLWDKNPQAIPYAMEHIRSSLEDISDLDTNFDIDAVLGRIKPSSTLDEAVKDVDYIQESVAETVQIKKEIFQSLDQYADKKALIGSSTSAIAASDFLGEIEGRHRCLIVHPVNPPHIIPLVELCGSRWTGSETISKAKSIMEELGQSPVILNKEIDGFALNRLQWALLGEAMHLVGEGYCSVEDIDKVLTQGLALRWSFIGPFEVGHLNATQGLKGYFQVLQEAISRVQNSLETDYAPNDELIGSAHDNLAQRMPVEDIPKYQAWRDRRLLQLRKHLEGSEPLE